MRFGNDVRAIVPQIAMSAGTMIALSCKEILMGKHSNLGPIDPQLRGVPCQSVLEEFRLAKEEVKANPVIAPLWQTIIGKYHPTFLIECKHANDWSEQLAEEWLTRNMCNGDNVSGLGEGGEYEAQNCQPALHLIRSTNVQLTTEPPLSLSPCYR